MSGALQLPEKDEAKAREIRHAVELVDQVHGANGLPLTPVRSVDFGSSRSYGRFDPETHEIEINSNPAHSRPVLATLHEIGHLLDYAALPGEKYATATYTDLLAPWWKAVYDSQRFTQLKAEGWDALLPKRELFANSYAQFIATRTQDSAALAELAALAKSEPEKVWAQEDFQPIVRALEELCQKMSWLKK